MSSDSKEKLNELTYNEVNYFEESPSKLTRPPDFHPVVVSLKEAIEAIEATKKPKLRKVHKISIKKAQKLKKCGALDEYVLSEEDAATICVISMLTSEDRRLLFTEESYRKLSIVILASLRKLPQYKGDLYFTCDKKSSRTIKKGISTEGMCTGVKTVPTNAISGAEAEEEEDNDDNVISRAAAAAAEDNDGNVISRAAAEAEEEKDTGAKVVSREEEEKEKDTDGNAISRAAAEEEEEKDTGAKVVLTAKGAHTKKYKFVQLTPTLGFASNTLLDAGKHNMYMIRGGHGYDISDFVPEDIRGTYQTIYFSPILLNFFFKERER